MFFSSVQSQNAFSPMLVTLLGMETEDSPAQPENAFAPMAVNPSGRMTLVIGRPLHGET